MSRASELPLLLTWSQLRATVLQLKIAYSVHRDLNVKANNDKSWDYGGGTPGAAAGPGPPTNGYNPSAGGSLAADEPPTGFLFPHNCAGVGCPQHQVSQHMPRGHP